MLNYWHTLNLPTLEPVHTCSAVVRYEVLIIMRLQTRVMRLLQHYNGLSDQKRTLGSGQHLTYKSFYSITYYICSCVWWSFLLVSVVVMEISKCDLDIVLGLIRLQGYISPGELHWQWLLLTSLVIYTLYMMRTNSAQSAPSVQKLNSSTLSVPLDYCSTPPIL